MTLKKLILIEVIIALILTFAGCSNSEEVQSTGGGDKFETTETTEVEETISDDEAYTLGYVFGYNLGISNRTKDYDEPEYPDNKEYMRGLDEGYENGLNDFLINYEDYDEEYTSDDYQADYTESESNWAPCVNCGKEVCNDNETHYTVDHMYYCTDCGAVLCEDEIHNFVGAGEVCLCNECDENHTLYCEECGQPFAKDYYHSGRNICMDCGMKELDDTLDTWNEHPVECWMCGNTDCHPFSDTDNMYICDECEANWNQIDQVNE